MAIMEGGKMNNKIHGFFVSAYCSLMLTSVVIGHGGVRLAAMGGAGQALQSGALAALRADAGDQAVTNVPTVRAVSAVSQAPMSIDQIISVVTAKGGQVTMPAHISQRFGLPAQEYTVTEIEVVQAPEKRIITVAAIDGKKYALISHMTSSEVWMFRVASDGTIEKGLYAVKGQGQISVSDGQVAAKFQAEQDYWSAWLSNSANVASIGQTGSRS